MIIYEQSSGELGVHGVSVHEPHLRRRELQVIQAFMCSRHICGLTSVLSDNIV